MNTRNATGPFQKGQTRRQFLKVAGCGVLGAMAGGLWSADDLFAAGAESPDAFTPDLDIALWAEPGEVALFPGRPTTVWRYRATVLKGRPSRIVDSPDSYLGPTIKAQRGEKVRIRFRNQLSEETIVHWHGLHVPAIMDGHPRYAVRPGSSSSPTRKSTPPACPRAKTMWPWSFRTAFSGLTTSYPICPASAWNR